MVGIISHTDGIWEIWSPVTFFSDIQLKERIWGNTMPFIIYSWQKKDLFQYSASYYRVGKPFCDTRLDSESIVHKPTLNSNS